jgi:hypothetical protein
MLIEFRHDADDRVAAIARITELDRGPDVGIGEQLARVLDALAWFLAEDRCAIDADQAIAAFQSALGCRTFRGHARDLDARLRIGCQHDANDGLAPHALLDHRARIGMRIRMRQLGYAPGSAFQVGACGRERLRVGRLSLGRGRLRDSQTRCQHERDGAGDRFQGRDVHANLLSRHRGWIDRSAARQSTLTRAPS